MNYRQEQCGQTQVNMDERKLVSMVQASLCVFDGQHANMDACWSSCSSRHVPLQRCAVLCRGGWLP